MGGPGWDLTQSTVSACYHLLYMGKKASSSSQTPPPPADDLLNHYTCEQMRAHWLSLGLSEKPVSFSPKAYDTRVTGKDKDGNEVRAVTTSASSTRLKESALLTGVFNRLARSCFYGVAVKEGDESPYRNGCIPAGAASATVVEAAEQAALAFEQAMYKFETHHALAVCDDYLRAANKRWSDASKAANKLEGEPANAAMTQALVDAFTELRVATCSCTASSRPAASSSASTSTLTRSPSLAGITSLPPRTSLWRAWARSPASTA